MLMRTTALLLGAMLLFSACDSARGYPERGDENYDLKAMSITKADLPAGFSEQDLSGVDFDNDTWAGLFDGVTDKNGDIDRDAKQAKRAQLDAQKRIRSSVSSFDPPELGKVFGVTAISTLYENDQAARDAASKFACGLPLDIKAPLEEFSVPTIGQGANGFFYNKSASSGLHLVDTTICFRTGRVIHSVQSTGLPGTEDVALTVRLAEKMNLHVNAFFDGRAPAATAAPAKKP